MGKCFSRLLYIQRAARFFLCMAIISHQVSGQSAAASPGPVQTPAKESTPPSFDTLPDALNDIRVDHVSLSVEDLDREIAWYGRVLGFKEANRRATPSMTNVNLRNASFRIDLIKYPGSKRTPADPVYLQQGLVHLALNVPDIPAAKAALVALGVDVKGGATVLIVRDPEGNEIEIFARK